MDQLDVLVNTLTQLNIQLSVLAESFKKMEQGGIENFKDNYKFKSDILNIIKNFEDKIQELYSIINKLTSQLDITDENLLKVLNEIKHNLDVMPQIDPEKLLENIQNKISAKIKLSDDCTKCQLLEKERKINGLLVKLLIASVGIILTLLGLNLLGKIKLPI
ncbi:MAG: hypothetical protein PHP92_04240 [Candidatus Nanoarchaeia archaeon]|nr:hypothetical protein [Candidatus Nanoarchaeia archaeon]